MQQMKTYSTTSWVRSRRGRRRQRLLTALTNKGTINIGSAGVIIPGTILNRDVQIRYKSEKDQQNFGPSTYRHYVELKLILHSFFVTNSFCEYSMVPFITLTNNNLYYQMITWYGSVDTNTERF